VLLGRDETITLPGGRALGYAEAGVPDGPPVLFFHGTWLSRLAHLGEAPAQAGVRLLYVDRPGYGQSDVHPGRTLLDWPRDVEAFADALGLDAFAVAGYSGGASHALACAAALPGRIRCAAVVSGVGPATDDPAVTAAVRASRREQVELARVDPGGAARLILDEVTAEVAQLAADPDPVAGVEQPGLRRRIEASLRETAARGVDGPVPDLTLNYLRPWGFRLQDIAIPVVVWHAENDDDVPAGVGRAVAARLPAAHPTFTPAGGHLMLWTRAGDILRHLQAARKTR
jgi:pimeloyl-ACP methyl ester carboxylesterase